MVKTVKKRIVRHKGVEKELKKPEMGGSEKRQKELASDKPLKDLQSTVRQDGEKAPVATEKKAEGRNDKKDSKGFFSGFTKGEDESGGQFAGRLLSGRRQEGLEEGEVVGGSVPLVPNPAAIVPALGGSGISLGGAIGDGILSGIGKASQLALSAPGKAVLSGTAGTSGIMTWLANDNIISGMNIFARDLASSVKFNGLDPQVALGQMEEAQGTVDGARNFINSQTTLNPLLWPFRGIIMTNVDAAQNTLDFHKKSIEGFEQPLPEDLNTGVPQESNGDGDEQ